MAMATTIGFNFSRLGLEADRLYLKEANRMMEEEARIAKREADLLAAASAVLVSGMQFGDVAGRAVQRRRLAKQA